jgi:hypothetical protein
MTSKSKNKGNSWERDVAKHLTSIYNETFIRAPGSGAYVGGSNTKRKQFLHEGQIRSFKGDIIPGQSFPKFNAECKSYADFPFHQLFDGSVKQLDSWLDQLMQAADEADFNILIMKFNRKGKYIAVQAHEKFELANHMTYKDWEIMEYDTFWKLNKDAVAKRCA